MPPHGLLREPLFGQASVMPKGVEHGGMRGICGMRGMM